MSPTASCPCQNSKAPQIAPVSIELLSALRTFFLKEDVFISPILANGGNVLITPDQGTVFFASVPSLDRHVPSSLIPFPLSVFLEYYFQSSAPTALSPFPSWPQEIQVLFPYRFSRSSRRSFFRKALAWALAGSPPQSSDPSEYSFSLMFPRLPGLSGLHLLFSPIFWGIMSSSSFSPGNDCVPLGQRLAFFVRSFLFFHPLHFSFLFLFTDVPLPPS